VTHVVIDPPAGTVRYAFQCGFEPSPVVVDWSDFAPDETDPDSPSYGNLIYGLYDPPPTFPGLTPGCCNTVDLFSKTVTVDASADISGVEFDGDPPLGVVVRPIFRFNSPHPDCDKHHKGKQQTALLTFSVDGQECFRWEAASRVYGQWFVEYAAGLAVEGFVLDDSTWPTYFPDTDELPGIGIEWFGDPFFGGFPSLIPLEKNDFVFWGPDNGGTLPATVELHFELTGIDTTPAIGGCGASQRPDAECIGVHPEPYGTYLVPNVLNTPEIPVGWSVEVYPVCLVEPTAAGIHVV